MNISNKTSSLEKFINIFNEEYKIVILMIILGIILLTITLNLFIFLSVLLYKNMKNYTNLQFASMSLADMLIGLIAMPCMMISTLYEYWPLSNDFCIAWCIGDFISGHVSFLCLCVISYHRLECIRDPVGIKKKPKTHSFLPIALIWSISVVFWTISIVFIRKNYSRSSYLIDYKECYYLYNLEFILVIDLIVYIIPICYIVILQLLIYVFLKNKDRLINLSSRHESQRSKPPTDKELMARKRVSIATTTVMHSQKCSNTNHKKNTVNLDLKVLIRNTKNRKAFVTLFCVTVFIILFWSPWIILWPINAYCNCIPRPMYSFAYWMKYMNSFTNPIILILGNKHFNSRFKSVFK